MFLGTLLLEDVRYTILLFGFLAVAPCLGYPDHSMVLGRGSANSKGLRFENLCLIELSDLIIGFFFF